MPRLLGPLVQLVVAVGGAALVLRWLLRLLGRRQQVFQVNYWRGVYLLLWPLAGLCVALPMLRPLLAGPTMAWEIALFSLLFLLLLGFALPSLLLHLQYYRLNRHTTLLFDPKGNVLEVYEGPLPLPFARADIRQVEYAVCRARGMFWQPYEYLRLHLHDGRVITLTSLLTALRPVAEFLRNTHLQRHERWICWL